MANNLNYEPKINALVNSLRIIAEDDEFIGKEIVIPNGSDQAYFIEGNHRLDKLLYYLADMLEE